MWNPCCHCRSNANRPTRPLCKRPGHVRGMLRQRRPNGPTRDEPFCQRMPKQSIFKVEKNHFEFNVTKIIKFFHSLYIRWVFHVVHHILMASHSSHTLCGVRSPQIKCEIIGARNERLNTIRTDFVEAIESHLLEFDFCVLWIKEFK